MHPASVLAFRIASVLFLSGYISHVHVLNMENLDKEVWGRKCKWPMVSSSKHNDLIFCCISSHHTFRQFRSYYKKLVSCFFKLYFISWSFPLSLNVVWKWLYPFYGTYHVSNSMGFPHHHHHIICICNKAAMNTFYLVFFLNTPDYLHKLEL